MRESFKRWYSRCSRRSWVVVRFSGSVSVSSTKVFVVVVVFFKHGQDICSRRISCLSCCILPVVTLVVLES